MAIDLTNVRARINNVKRNLYYDAGTTLTFYDINEILATLTENWWMQISPTSNLAIGQEYFELSVADVDDSLDLSKIIPFASAIGIAGEKYKVVQYERPRALTKQWRLRVGSTGMKS
jgi:hypothetical protein